MKHVNHQGKQEWRTAESAPFPASRRFSLGTTVFPSTQKPIFSNSNLIWNSRATGLPVASRFIYLFHFFYSNQVDLFIYLFISTQRAVQWSHVAGLHDSYSCVIAGLELAHTNLSMSLTFCFYSHVLSILIILVA